MSQSPISNVDTAHYRQAFSLSEIAEDDHGDALGHFVEGHAKAMTFIDVLIEEVPDVHAPYITEEAFNSEGLFVFYYCIEVQLEKLDHHFYPLELVRFKLNGLSSLNHVFATRAAALSLVILILSKEALSNLLLLRGIDVKALIDNAIMSAAHF